MQPIIGPLGAVSIADTLDKGVAFSSGQKRAARRRPRLLKSIKWCYGMNLRYAAERIEEEPVSQTKQAGKPA